MVSSEMNIINLQNKTKPKEGTIEFYCFKNESIGLINTLFHRITIPLEPFDSGLDYVERPEQTELVIDWIQLGLKDPSLLAGVEITSEFNKEMEASIYIGSAHNSINIKSLELKEIAPNKYELNGSTTIEFENEGVAKNEEFEFKTTALFIGDA